MKRNKIKYYKTSNKAKTNRYEFYKVKNNRIFQIYKPKNGWRDCNFYFSVKFYNNNEWLTIELTEEQLFIELL